MNQHLSKVLKGHYVQLSTVLYTHTEREGDDSLPVSLLRMTDWLELLLEMKPVREKPMSEGLAQTNISIEE